MFGTGRGWQLGMRNRGYLWWGAGGAWRGGAYVTGGMHGRGSAWQRACVAGEGMHGRGVCLGGCEW